MTRRVLICGSRHWSDWQPIAALIESLPADAVVIEGGALGADAIAKRYASTRGLTVVTFPADWNSDGNRAGPIRNQRMIDEGGPTEAHAFPLPDSIGTWDMVRRCVKAGVPVTIHEGEAK